MVVCQQIIGEFLMEPSSSMQSASVLLGIGAVGGLLMAGIRLSGRPRPPTPIVMLHGVLAAAGLTLLIYAALTVGVPPMTQLAIGILIVAALGGAVMNLGYHSKALPLPIPLMLGHAVLAAAGFALLLLSMFSRMLPA
jgi:hypothetical protein